MNAGEHGGDHQQTPPGATVRDAVRTSVVSRSPVDERERRSINSFLEHFDRLDDPFSETSDPVHVTGSAIITGRRGVILLRHKHLGIWVQPGGHVDVGEAPWDGALREAQEETGLDVRHASTEPQMVHVDVHAGAKGHTHLDLRYLLVAPDLDPVPPANESQDVHWFSWDEAIELGDEGVVGALRQIRATLAAAAGEVSEGTVREIGEGGVL